MFKAQKFGMGLLGDKCLFNGFFLVLLEAAGIFWVLIFAPIRLFPSLEIRSTPLGVKVYI